jgi:CDGSH-type Zn-finger protein
LSRWLTGVENIRRWRACRLSSCHRREDDNNRIAFRSAGNGIAFLPELKHKKAMTEPIIFQKSPIVQKVEPGKYWWCACGRSKSQPFCDGSHKGSGLGPNTVEIIEAKTVAWCACKHSKTPPFCDGSHSQLP